MVRRSLSNLNVLTVNGKDVGFIYKPLNSRTDRNAWRVFLGLGNDAKFMGHSWHFTDAKRMLEGVYTGNV